MLEFARTVQPDLSNFEADGVSPPTRHYLVSGDTDSHDQAWPSMLDDFVAWKKPESKEANVNVDDDEE